METKKKEILQRTLEKAKNLGVEQCDIIFSEGNSLSLSVQGGDVDSYKVSGSAILGIRSIKNSRVGLSYTEEFSDDALENIVKKSIENSQLSRLNEAETIIGDKEENIYEDKKSEDVEAKTLIDLGLRLEKETKAKSDKVAAVPYNGVSESESSSYYLNSNERFCYEEDYSLSCYTSALIKDGDKNSLHYKGVVSKSFDQLDYQQCIEDSFYHANEWLNASSISSGKYPVIFSIGQLDSLIGAFQRMFSAKAVIEKNNPMSDKKGKSIFHKELTFIDSPMDKQFLFHSPFDSEGFKRNDLTLIENGELRNFLHNSVTAKILKEENNFRAARGARSSLGVSGSNFKIAAGTASESDLHQGQYLKIYSIQGLHSGLNFMSGDFSFGASGYLMEGENAVQAVNGITVAGNFYEMFNQIDAVGKKQHLNSSGNFLSPELRFSALTIAGNA